MALYGKNESGDRLHLTGVGGLYVLKSDEKKIIKVLQPPEGIWTAEQMREEVEGFLLRAKTQQAIARKSQNWAPIVEAAAIRAGTEGSSGGGAEVSQAQGEDYRASGAYLVMDRYERTAQSLIDGRVNLNNDDLRNVMSGVLKGLRDIRKAANRPHGNLKPSNILLANTADLAKAAVFLSDPAADGTLTPNSEKREYADLARILYELVNLRPYQGGIVPKSKDWNELGPNGEDWRKLCNTLIDWSQGGGTADERDLDKLLAKIDTWRAKPRKSALPLIAAAVVLLIIAGTVGAWWFTREKKIDFNEGNWDKLCLSYYAWFDNVAEMDEATKKKFLSDPRYPAEVVKLLDKAASDLPKYKPQTISQTMQSSQSLAGAPTDQARTGYGPNYTKHGDDLIDKVSEALTPAKWPLLTTLDQTATTYEQRGWTKPAAGIRGLIASAKPPVIPPMSPDIATKLHPVDMLASIDNTVTAAKAVTDIEQSWNDIAKKIDGVEKIPGNIPLLQSFKKFAEDLPKAQSAGAAPGEGTLEDVKALASSFAQINQALDKLAALKDPPFDLTALAADPAAQYASGDSLSVQKYNNLLAVAERDYKRIVPDPRTAMLAPNLMQDAQTDIDIIGKANRQDEHLADLSARREALLKEIAALKGMAPISKNLAAITVRVAAIDQSRGALALDSATWSTPYKVKPAEYIAGQEKRIAAGMHAATAAVEAQWHTASENLLKKIKANPDELKIYTISMATEAKFKAIDAAYADFDQKKIPLKVEGLSAFVTADWRFAIASRVATTYREQAIEDLMANVKFADDVPQVSDPAYQSFEKQRLGQYEQARRDALGMIEDFTTIQGRLDHLDLLPDEPAKGDKSWRELLEKWKGTAGSLAADPKIAEALRPITDRTSALLALDKVGDYASLQKAEMAGSPEIALKAWRKIGGAAVNETLPVLKDEDDGEAHLGEVVADKAKQGMIDGKRAGALKGEIAGQRPVRWRHYADTVVSAKFIEEMLDRRAAFGVMLAAPADANLMYDELLYKLRKDYEEKLPDARMKEVAQDFINNVNQLGKQAEGIGKDAGVQELLGRIAKPLAPGAGDVSTAGAGPKLAGWEQENKGPEIRIFYWPQKAGAKETLEFKRIQVPGSGKSTYLCITETSLGVFSDAVTAANGFADVGNKGKTGNQAHWMDTSNDPWSGPRVWQIKANEFVPNTDWLSLPPTMAGIDPFPKNQKPAAPSVTHPMQQLSPWAAMYVARLLGCRLPTSDEWAAAYKLEGTQGQPKDSWNLRGTEWAAQKAWADQNAVKGLTYPDAAAFLPDAIMYDPITGKDALPWQSSDLAKLNPACINNAGGVYPTSVLWFRSVAEQPGAKAPGQGAGIFHDLVGNVAEYVFNGDHATDVIKEQHPRLSVDQVDSTIKAGAKNLFVIGGSSLSSPKIPFDKPQPVNLDVAATGFADVGFRLAYTAPIDSITDVLAQVFHGEKAVPYLPVKVVH